MTIEQRPELNRFVDPSIIEPWQQRWQRLKLFLPIWLYVLALFLELGLLGAWLSDKPLLKCLAVSLGPWLGVFLAYIVLSEIALRLYQRAKRALQFQTDKIILGSGKLPCVAWKEVVKIQFEPVAESPNLTKLILTRLMPRKKGKQKSDMLIIENPIEVQELIAFLRKQKMEAPTNYEIVILDTPSSLPQLPNSFWSMSIFLAGLFLLQHGGPILISLLGFSGHKSDDDSRFTPDQRTKLAHFVTQHFSSKEEFRHFFLMLSICLITVGSLLLVLGGWLMNRKPRVAPTLRSV